MRTHAPNHIAFIRDDPRRFPLHVLRGAKTGLCVFAAEWHGRQDAFWLYEAGIKTTCVDIQGNKLQEMLRIYPREWAFRQMDAFEFISTTEVTYDVVTADPFTGETMERCHRDLLSFCRLARHAVVMGSTAAQPIHRAPEGWRITDTVHRSDFGGGVFWTVLRPE